MNKFKLFIISLISITGIINFSFSAYPISYNFDSPIVFGSNTFYFSSSSNINYLLSTVSHSAEKYFCISNLYYGANQTIINSYLGDLTFYNCYDSQSLTADLELQDCYKLQKSYGTTTSLEYQQTGYNCYQLQWRDNVNPTYVYASRRLTGGNTNQNRQATVYNSIIDFNTLVSNRQLFNQNFCTTNNLCPSCPSQYTSLQCQTEYNLIPIEDITANYCKLNFNLIEPSECQGNSTGETIFSNLYINNTRYPGASNIYLGINDNLGYTYNNTGGQIEVNVDFNVDEDYLIDVINKEKLTPTNGDFEALINGLQYYLPYIMIALLLGRIVYVLKKVFRF